MDDAEFTKRRSRAEFDGWIDKWSTSRIAGIEEYSSLMRRAEKFDKKMVEEAIPMHKYVRRFHDVSCDIFVQLNSESGARADGYDAVISSRTGDVLEYVQVTGVPAKDEHIDRLIVSGVYKVPASDDQPEVTKKSYDQKEHLRQLNTFHDLNGYRARVAERVRKKLQNAYQKPAILVVVLDPDMIVEDERRFAEVVAEVDEIVGNGGPFSRIVVMAFGTGLVKCWDFE